MAETTTRIYELQVKLAQDSLAQLKKLEGTTKGIETSFKSLTGVVGGFAEGLAAAFSVGAIIAAVNQAISVVDELGAAAQRAGVGVETFSALAYAAEQSDMALADLEVGLKELQKSMVETGTKGANVLDALGIDKTKPQVEVLKDFAEAFKTIEDPALRTNALLEVFGKSGLKLRPLLESGAVGIDTLMAKAKELGIVISEDVAKSFSDLDNEIKTTQKVAETLTRDMTSGLAPALTDVMQGFQGAAKQGDFFKTVGEGLGLALRGLGAGALFVTTLFKQFGTIIGGVSAAMAQFFTGNFTEAGNVIRELNTDIAANKAAYQDQLDTMLGIKPVIESVTTATDKNTKSVTNNDAAIRKALTTTEKEKKAKAEVASEFEKLTKVLDDQLFRLRQVGQEDTELAKALRAVGMVFVQLNPLQQMHVMQLLAEVAATDQLNKETKKRKEALDELDGILKGLMTDEEKFNQELHRLQELMAQFPERAAEIEEAQRRLWERFIQGQKKVNDEVTETDKLLEQLADKVDGYAKSIADTMVDFATGAEDAKFSFHDFATSVLRDLLKMTTQMLIIEPLMKNFKDWLKTTGGSGSTGGGGLSSFVGAIAGLFTANARGGVYASPSLSAYSGGVYTAPRVFAFASGAGVFAEAGPEAIMPLTRTADGSLGVQSTGGGDVTVNVINEAGADVDVKASRNAMGQREVTVMIQQAVVDGFTRGRFDSVMGSTYGVTRRGR